MSRTAPTIGDSIIQDPNPHGRVTFMHGVLRDMETGKPIVGAVLDPRMTLEVGETPSSVTILLAISSTRL
jgi:hypothetical protein